MFLHFIGECSLQCPPEGTGAQAKQFCVAAGCVYQISCRQLVIEAVHKVHTGGVTALAVGPRVCATAGRDHRLCIWRLGSGALLLEVCSEW